MPPVRSVGGADGWQDASMHDRLPPTPSLSPMRQAIALGTDPYAFLLEQARELGPVFTLSLPNDRRAVVVGEAGLVKALWAMTPEQIDAATQPGLPINLGPNGLILLDGEQHARHRKLLTPPLHGKALRAQAGDMSRRARQMVDAWPLGEPAPVLPLFQRLALDVVLECAVGELDPEQSEKLGAAFIGWMDGMLTPLSFAMVQLLPARKVRAFFDRRAMRSRVRADGSGRRRHLPWNRLADRKAYVMAVIRERLAAVRAHADDEAHDVLSMLARTRLAEGGALADDEIVDEIVTMGVGGVETTANTLAWCIHHLLDHPEAMARARAEVDAAFAETGVDPTRLDELPWLSACLDESMRLCPVSLAAPRRLARELRLGAWTLPVGTDLWVSSILAHHDPERWEEPERFRPERFLDGKVSPNDWFPFGGGRRHCIGRAFASVEMRIALAEVLLRLDLARAEGSAPTPAMRGMTVGPSDGVCVVARRRG